MVLELVEFWPAGQFFIKARNPWFSFSFSGFQMPDEAADRRIGRHPASLNRIAGQGLKSPVLAKLRSMSNLRVLRVATCPVSYQSSISIRSGARRGDARLSSPARAGTRR